MPAPCLLSQGYSYVGCKTGAGGIRRVLITEFENVTAYTIAANVITGITKPVGKVFREYLLDKEMGSFSDNGTHTLASGTNSYAPTIDFTIKSLTTSVKNEIKLLSQNTLLMICESRDGTYWLFGKVNGMDLLTWSAESGKALTDFRGQNLHFEGKESDYSMEVSSAIIAGLLV